MAVETDVKAIMDAVAGHGDLDYATTAMLRLPADVPIRSRLAAGLLMALLRSNLNDDLLKDNSRVSRFEALLAIAEEDPPEGREWRAVRAHIRTLIILASTVHGQLADPASANKELATLALEVGDNPMAQSMNRWAQTAVSFYQADNVGDTSIFAQVLADLDGFEELAATRPEARSLIDTLKSMMGLFGAHSRGEDIGDSLREVVEASDALPPGSPVREAVQQLTTLSGPLQKVFADGPGAEIDVSPAELVAIERLANAPDADADQRAAAHQMLSGVILRAGRENDVDRVRLGVEHARTAARLSRRGSTYRVFHLTSLGLALWRLNEVSNSVEDLNEAAEALTSARELAAGPQNSHWSFISELLANVKRRQGERGSRSIALDGLRSNAWKVLLHNDAETARFAARDAGESAVSTARQCLADSEPADAIRALDAGRSLMLFAAAEFHDIEARLVDAGRPDLAGQWREAVSAEPDHLPASLRRDIVTVLAEASDILDPPGLAELHRALRILDADALVYLVAGTESGQTGWAVIVSAQGQPSFVSLPNLLIDNQYDVERYLHAVVSRDLEAPSRRHADLVDSLDTLCRWAWRVAIGPIAKQYLPTVPKPASGRPHHIVLVPMGELAQIPWHAARGQDGRYAVADIAFSYAPSARLLCRAATLPPVPRLPLGLVVGDPDIDDKDRQLVAARVEAYAIHKAFYLGGRYVGTNPDGSPSPAGAGTADEIRAWFTDARPQAGATLHLACHGVTDVDPKRPTSYLVLAGGEHLSADEIVRLLARSPGHDVGLAVLAACRTSQSIHGYDEAYSLGSAFLASGVRTVLSTQWAIPDQETSLLMFMFHHYLMVDRQPAWAALQQAQLWMLDPRRQPPATMPAELREQLDDRNVAGIESWAGFIHFGQ